MKDVFQEFELPFETYFEKEVHHEDQVHDEVELIWLLKGNASVVVDGIYYPLKPQTLFMVNIGQVHTVNSDVNSMIISYRFKKEHLQKNNVMFEHYRFVNRVYTLKELVVKYREVPLLITQLLSILISPNQSKVVRYRIIGYYNMFVYELYTMLLKEKYMDIKKKNYDTYMERLSKVTNYVQDNFKQKVSLEELAEIVNLSKYRLSHFIKEYLGIPLQEYVKRVRLDYALNLLRTTDTSVIDVARLSGFSDVKYLNESLKSKLGLTALKYRKLIGLKMNEKRKVSEEFRNELKLCLITLEQSLGLKGGV